jgi:hypothetical protein
MPPRHSYFFSANANNVVDVMVEVDGSTIKPTNTIVVFPWSSL